MSEFIEPMIEELLREYIQVDKQEQETRSVKGHLLDAMLNKGFKQKFISSQIGVSPAQIKELVHLSRIYPTPESRLSSLSWYKHHVASYSNSFKELLKVYTQVDEQQQKIRFIKGLLLDSMLHAGAKQKFLSSQIGVSPAQIRELVYVYRTFPTATSRIPYLSCYLHREAVIQVHRLRH